MGGGEDEGDVGGGGDGRDFARETIGEEIIVRVKVVNVGGGGEGEAAGGVPSLPEVGLVTVDAETGIGVGGEEVRGGIGGGIVDEDNFEVLEGLGEDGVEGLPEGGGAIIGGDEDGNEGGHR